MTWTVARPTGRLIVYLGSAPGVGKTYAALGEAQRRLARGTDVVVGFVETHDREQTAAQLEGLEVVPRTMVDYRGATFTEMDVDAVLARKPAVALRRRAGAHQRPRQPAREAGPGRRGAAGGRHRRHHHRQHPAPRVAQRRGRADHRRPPAGDRPGRGGPHRRPDPAGRHVPRRAAPADGARQHLQGRQGRRLAHVVLPGRQPDRAPRAGAALAGRPGRRPARRLPARAPDPGALAGQGADRRRGHRRSRERDADPARRPAGPAGGRRRAAGGARDRHRRPAQRRRAPARPRPGAGRLGRRAPSTPWSARTSRPRWSTSRPAPTPR